MNSNICSENAYLSLANNSEKSGIQINCLKHGLENREYGRRNPSHCSYGTFYPQKLVPTSPTSGGHSVGIVRSWNQATEFFIAMHFVCPKTKKYCNITEVTSYCRSLGLVLHMNSILTLNTISCDAPGPCSRFISGTGNLGWNSTRCGTWNSLITWLALVEVKENDCIYVYMKRNENKLVGPDDPSYRLSSPSRRKYFLCDWALEILLCYAAVKKNNEWQQCQVLFSIFVHERNTVCHDVLVTDCFVSAEISCAMQIDSELYFAAKTAVSTVHLEVFWTLILKKVLSFSCSPKFQHQVYLSKWSFK
jgi:hypothetical protein